MKSVESAIELPKALADARDQLFWDRRLPPASIGSDRFILKVMEIGTWEMVEALEFYFPRQRLVDALKAAPCGALAPKSWNFWCLRLGVKLDYPSRFAPR